MAAEQQRWVGSLPPLGDQFNLKANASPAGEPFYQDSSIYHLPCGTAFGGMASGYQPPVETQHRLQASNDARNPPHLSDRYYQKPYSGAPSASTIPRKPKDRVERARSRFYTFSATDMSRIKDVSTTAGLRSEKAVHSLHSSTSSPAATLHHSSLHGSKRLKTMEVDMEADDMDGTRDASPGAEVMDRSSRESSGSPTPERVLSGIKRSATGRLKMKAKKAVGPTRLRKSKPVQAAIPMDIWEMIMPYCPLRFLFTARNINTDFRERLKYESIWRKCRIWNYGPDMPDPLPGMKEWDYADLLEGLGCMGCGNKRTRKTYWAFQKRWCKDCLAKKSTLESSAVHLLYKHPKILKCIPHGTFDSWGHYESAGNYNRPGWQRVGHGQQRGYELAAVTRQLQETEAFLGSREDGEARTAAEIEAWYAPKMEATSKLLSHIQVLEDWTERSGREKIYEAGRQRSEREKFYKDRALTMDPPLQAAALERIPAYKRAINISRAPGERSWQLLLPKLKEQRAMAEQWVQDDQERQERVELNQRLSLEYANLMNRRSRENTPEQRLVLQLAETVLRNLDKEVRIHPIDDTDFVLLVLRAVREKYYRLDEAEKPPAYDGSGTYRLLMDDARMVYELKISPAIELWQNPLRSKAARLFKCPGCPRTDINLRYGFLQLFCHLNEKHARHIGDFSMLRGEPLQLPIGVRFPWCRLEWPPNLPVLAEHHTSTGTWDPNDESDYVLAPLKPAPANSLKSLFEKRSVHTASGPANQHFVDNIVYAATLLRGTPLTPSYQTQLALKFAVDKYAMYSLAPPSNEEMVALDLARIRTGNYPLFDWFRCKACCDSHEPARNNKFVNKPQPYGELASHFKSVHPHLSWVSDMLVLPSETDLWMALVEPGMESARAAFDRLFPPSGESAFDLGFPEPFVAPVARML